MEEDKKEHQTMKEIYDSSVFGVGNKVLKSVWNKKRKLFILGTVIVVLLSNFLVIPDTCIVAWQCNCT